MPTHDQPNRFQCLTPGCTKTRHLPSGYCRDHRLAGRCPLVFKDEQCGYDGPETSCDKTPSRCRELGNFERFVGFPGIPQHHGPGNTVLENVVAWVSDRLEEGASSLIIGCGVQRDIEDAWGVSLADPDVRKELEEHIGVPFQLEGDE